MQYAILTDNRVVGGSLSIALLFAGTPNFPSLRVSYMGARSSTQGASGGDPTIATSTEQIDFKSLSESDWKKRLTEEQYYVARKKGTERAFTGQYWNTKTPGVYHCICCDAPLFASKAKFDSGTGWPSYYEFIGENVKMERDWSIPFMPRTEVLCATCDAHLGHVFNDGPRPTGKRYCINSASIVLWPTKEK